MEKAYEISVENDANKMLTILMPILKCIAFDWVDNKPDVQKGKKIIRIENVWNARAYNCELMLQWSNTIAVH